MAVLILAQRPNGDQLTYAAGVMYWVEGSTGISREVSQALTQANRFPTIAGWLLAIVPLVLLAARAFYSSAVRGCGAASVNSTLALLTNALLFLDAPAMTYLTFQLLGCLAKGLAAPGSLVIGSEVASPYSLVFTTPAGASLAALASEPVGRGIRAVDDGGYLVNVGFKLAPLAPIILDSQFRVVATVSAVNSWGAASNHLDGFYVLEGAVAGDATLSRINLAGEIVDQWTVAVPANQVYALAVSPDNTTLYVAQTNVTIDRVTKYILGGASSVFAAEAGGQVRISGGLLTLRNGNVLVQWAQPDGETKRYAADGTLLLTYPEPTFEGRDMSFICMCVGRDETTFWWAWEVDIPDEPEAINLIEEIDVATGAVVNSFRKDAPFPRTLGVSLVVVR